MLHLAFVIGTEPDKWINRFQERTPHGISATASDDPFGQAELALMRLPDARVNPETFHIVRLYEEQPGVALPKDHTLTLHEVVPSAELESEIVNFTASTPVNIQGLRDALQVVAANVGIAYAPRPLLKALCGKQVEHRGVDAGEPTTIALVWAKDEDSEAIQDFVGITRGRTPNSSRAGAAPQNTTNKLKKQQQKKTQQKRSGRGQAGNKQGHKQGAKQGSKQGRKLGRKPSKRRR